MHSPALPSPTQAPSGRGRPSKFTPSTCAQIVEYVRQGNFLNAAASAVGLDYTTVHNWLKRGEAAESEDDPYYQFYYAVCQAEGLAEVGLVATVQTHAQRDGRTAIAVLGRRFSDRWAEQKTVKHEGTSTVVHTLSLPAPGDLARLGTLMGLPSPAPIDGQAVTIEPE